MYSDISVMSLVPHPDNFKNRGDIGELVESVKQHGVMTPLLVRPFPATAERTGYLGGEGYQVLTGHRRLQVAMKLGLETLPCMVRELSDDEALEVLLVDNLERKELCPMDEAHAVRVLMTAWSDADAVAESLSRKVEWVKLRQSLLELGDEAQDAVSERKLCLASAAVILSVPKGEDREMAEQLVLHPTYQMEPLSAGEAKAIVSQTVLEPAKARKKWEGEMENVAWKVREELMKEYGERVDGIPVRPQTYDASVELGERGNYYEDAGSKVTHFVITEQVPLLLKANDARDGLRWFDLAERHGLAIEVIFDRDKGYRAVVNRGLICEGEKSRASHDQEPWICEATSKVKQAEEAGETEDSEESSGRDEGVQMAMLDLGPVRRFKDWLARECPMDEWSDKVPSLDYEEMSVDATADIIEVLDWVISLKGGLE